MGKGGVYRTGCNPSYDRAVGSDSKGFMCVVVF